jgi:signal transduction histidine kinase
MTTILTCAMLLQEETDAEDPKYTELQTIADETLRCRKIVTSLLDFARQTKTDKKQCNVNEIVKSCVVLTQKKAAFKDVAMEGYVTPEIPIVQADKDQIQQALINLTINAVEATEPGGTVTLKTGYDESGRIVRISVTDTGKGISEADMEKIFDPFFTTKESGTGLGLAITHGIIEQHNGTIGVRKNPEGGTIFEIDLPIEEV